MKPRARPGWARYRRNPGGRTGTVGVHVAASYLAAVRATASGVQEARYAALSPEGREDPGARARALARLLQDLCPRPGGLRFWAAVEFRTLRMWHVRIPRVPVARLTPTVAWALRKDQPNNAGRRLFDYLIEGEVLEGTAPKLDVTTYSVETEEVGAAVGLFQQAGYPLHGLLPCYFAVRNLFLAGRERVEARRAVVLHFGSAIACCGIFTEGRFVLNREFHIDSALLCRASGETETGGDERAAGELRRLLLQVEHTVAADPLAEPAAPPPELYLTGAPAADGRLTQLIQARTGYAVHTPSITVPASGNGSEPPPATPGGGTPHLEVAAGAASPVRARTPNLLYPAEERDRVYWRNRINRHLFAGIGLGILVLAGFHLLQVVDRSKLEARLADLSTRQAAAPAVTLAQVTDAAADVLRVRNTNRDRVRRRLPLALVREVERLTSPPVRLSRIDLLLCPARSSRAGSTRQRSALVHVPRGLSLSGWVEGDADRFSSSLAEYVANVEASPLFEGAAATRSEVADRQGVAVLQFVVRADVGASAQPLGKTP